MTTSQSSLPPTPRSLRRGTRTATISQTRIYVTSAAVARIVPNVYASIVTS